MAYTKCQYNGRCAIKSNEYLRTMARLELMIQEALCDFPRLSRDEIEFVIYGGTSRDRTTGIEFRAEDRDGNELDIPSTYHDEPGGLGLCY
jgi:hypothetical protein